ncbi:MAG: hypothetical protein ACI4JG_09540 [Acutalibacteraceae bacterium]
MNTANSSAGASPRPTLNRDIFVINPHNEFYRKNTAPVGNAVLGVPRKYSGFNGGLWASRPTLRACD